jgi:membrane-associated phospholipid phosphatase
MSTWRTASAVYFVYVAVVALTMPRVARRRRWRACACAAGGLAVAAVSGPAVPQVLLDWVIPPGLLLLGYWTSGLLFVAPMPWAERLLLGIDRRLRVRQIAAAAPRWLAELLELAYACVYVVIPAALVLLLACVDGTRTGEFWSVILVTDYVCFAALPWMQTRPPRAIEPGDPWPSGFRRINLRLLGGTSIQVNTFPSGHAAEALAAALLVKDAPWPAAAGMFLVAAAISAGTVLGRYHYAADAVAGWAVAIAVWLLITAV